MVLVHIVDHITIHYGRGGGSNDKKSLKIPKVYSGSVNRRRTDNTMAKQKVQKDKQRSTKHTHTTKDRVTPKKQGVKSGAPEG